MSGIPMKWNATKYPYIIWLAPQDKVKGLAKELKNENLR